MALTVAEVRDRLQKHFPQIFSDVTHQPYVSDYLEVGAFLSGPVHIVGTLDLLEQSLEDRMFTRLGYNASTAGQKLQNVRREYYLKQAQGQFNQSIDRFREKINQTPIQKDPVYSQLLTDELASVETNEQFALFSNRYGEPRVEMIMPLKADQFRDQLQKGRPFKDPTIGPDHGEYTHRLQWYLIARAGVLNQPVIDVYKHIGMVAWDGSGNPGTTHGAENFGLWDELCDRQPMGAPGLPQPFPFYKADLLDFRCPEALLTWLCQPAQLDKYPLVASFLKARKEKRAYIQNQDSRDDPLAAHYIALKLFNRPYNLLSASQQTIVDEFQQAGQQKGVLEPRLSGPGYKQRG
jgi:Family of unknown function (DUF5636)